ncbi:MAG: CocE/NonD family hydrolase [Planctomycetes bacterium]|nr:CocE/NonD family hydrolase [Planctomycetota bacterium]
MRNRFPSIALAALIFASPVIAAPKTDRVAMRDGIRLATDIHLPPGEGPWPSILIMTPYGRKGMGAFAVAMNARGYAAVFQDFRGRFDSEGEDWPVFQSCGWTGHRDGYDTVEWIASQPWSNGKVGGAGISGPGIALNMMAPSKPPHLVCLYVAIAFSSMYHQAAYQGGAFRKSLMETWLSQNKFSPDNLRTFRAHPDYDDFWRAYDCDAVADRVDVPVLFLGGWYDIFNAGTIRSYLTIQERGGPGARGKCRLVMEAYGHGRSADIIFPDTGRPPSTQILNFLDWFDLWMKKDGEGIEDIPPVRYYVMGDPADPAKAGNVWRSSRDWPIPAKSTPYYFHGDGTLRTEMPRKGAAPRTYTYDPADPVPTIGGANLMISKGPKDQRPVERRRDVLLFTSPALASPLEVTGPLSVKLWASSSAPDTDFAAKLCDVYPDGRSIIVADGIIRARHRKSLEKPEPLEPGKVYPFDIDLWWTSIAFGAGHRIRVAISSSNAPRFEPNPNTGKPSGTDREMRVAKNAIHLDAEHPSHIALPVIAP